jgi:hypothetical protein
MPPEWDIAILLARILDRLYGELEGEGGIASPDATTVDVASGETWRSRLEERLYLKGKPVRFLAGAAGSGEAVRGILAGVGSGGELLLESGGASRAFFAGELDVYG